MRVLILGDYIATLPVRNVSKKIQKICFQIVAHSLTSAKSSFFRLKSRQIAYAQKSIRSHSLINVILPRHSQPSLLILVL